MPTRLVMSAIAAVTSCRSLVSPAKTCSTATVAVPIPADTGAETVYVHVLYPTDTSTAAMPASSVEKKGADLVVKVADLTYTFKGP